MDKQGASVEVCGRRGARGEGAEPGERRGDQISARSFVISDTAAAEISLAYHTHPSITSPNDISHTPEHSTRGP